MNAFVIFKRLGFLSMYAFALMTLGAYSSLTFADELKIGLSGDKEFPMVRTVASGSATVTINADMTVNGGIKTNGIVATMAHIHQGASGTNGPVIISFTKSGDNAWTIPAGAKLTEAQYKAYKAGELYVNVHSAEHKGGEIRGQMRP